MFKRIRNLFMIKGYWVLLLCLFLMGMGLSTTLPYLSLFCTEKLEMSTWEFGLFIAVSSLSGVVVNSMMGRLSDRGFNRKSIIIFAMVSTALGYASYLYFQNYFILLIIVSLFSGLGAPAVPQMYAHAQESANASKVDDKRLAISTLRSFFSFGFFIGPLVGTLILQEIGYKGLFLTTSVTFITIASLVMLFIQKRERIPSTNLKRNSTDSILKTKQLRLPFIAFILLFAVNNINTINTPLFVTNELHGTHTEVGLVFSVCAGLEIPIMLVVGLLSKKISSHTLMIYGCFTAIVYSVILTFSTVAWQPIAAQVVQALFIAILMGNGLSYFHDLLPNSPGTASSIYANSTVLGKVAGSTASGLIAEIVGFRNVYVTCLAMALLSFLLFRSGGKQQEEESEPIYHVTNGSL